jgi:conjugative transfer pilus assembly protein TraH
MEIKNSLRNMALLGLVIPSISYANLGKDLQDYFSGFGAAANVTPGGAYQGQSGGLYTGGGAYVRLPRRDLQLMNIQMPSLAAGCGGIDAFMGGISYVDSRQLLQMFRAIGQNAQGYMFSLALSQISPQIMGKIQELGAWANDHNYNNMNSCRLATLAVDSSVGMVHDALKSTCIRQRTGGEDENYAKSSFFCQDQDRAKNAVKAAKNQGDLKNSAIESDVNVTWHAIQNNPILAKIDSETKYLLMSLTGTVVISVENSKKQVFPSLIDDGLLESLSTGGRVRVYACEGDTSAEGCLKVVEKEITIGGDATFIAQIRKKLHDIETRIGEDTEPSTDEIKVLAEFLDTNTIPIYQILNVQSAYSRGGSIVMSISEYTEIIAMDVLYKFLERGISDVMKSITNNLLPNKLQMELASMAMNARDRIQTKRQDFISKIKTTHEIIARVQMLEKQIYSAASSNLMGNIQWSNGMK